MHFLEWKSDRRQAIIWTSAGILLIWTLETIFSEILSKIHTFSLKKMHLKLSSAKRRPYCLSLNVPVKTAKQHEMKYHEIYRAVKLPWIFPGAPLTFNGAPGNIQGNLDRYGFEYLVYMFVKWFVGWMNSGSLTASSCHFVHTVCSVHDCYFFYISWMCKILCISGFS